MYAVIETGGKQYRVEIGTELEVELLDVEAGQSITLERVLLVADGAEAAVGTPVVAEASVEAEVVGRDRGDKVVAFKYRPKARRRVKKGHRQDYTVLRIADIRFNGKSAAAAAAKAEDTRKTERQRLQDAAARQAAEDAALAAKLAVGAATAETSAESTAEPAPKRARPKASDKKDSGKKASAADAPVKGAAKSGTKPAAKAKPAAETEPADAAKRTTGVPRKRTSTKKDD